MKKAQQEEKLKKNYLYGAIAILLIVCVALGIVVYQKQNKYTQAVENGYNMAFYELVDYVQNVESFLAKSLISSSPEHGAETLTNVWREANLASSYLAQLPIQNNELLNTQKFLNQVSDYSYTLSRKNIYNEALTEEDLKNLKELHQYSVDLKNTLGQLGAELADGKVSWKEFSKNSNIDFAQQVSNMSDNMFSNINKNFEEYAGLIYDGAFSEHANKGQMKALGDTEIDEETAKQKAKEFIGEDKIEDIISNGFIENGDIPSYDFSVKMKNGEKDNYAYISISKKGGQVVLMNYNRDIQAEAISQEEADKIGKDFLASKGFANMKETYYLKQEGTVTINYAYLQDDVTVYPDLIKLKIALDNGEILGIETSGYLNSHVQRDVSKVKIDKEKAKSSLNKDLQIESEGLAIIPTKWNSEILCWEFKGKVDDSEFLVYINAENGREEDILVIVNTPNGTLTM